jgi:hypothetical protein
MLERIVGPTDLIGYLTFSGESRRATLVVCGRQGRPLRAITLAPIGAFARFVIRLGMRLGRSCRSCRAIARDAGDARSFDVWVTSGRRLVVTDERGQTWLRSVGHEVRRRRHAAPPGAADADVVRVFCRNGFGDVGRN